MTKISAPSNYLGINLSYRYYLGLELLTENIKRTFKANTVKLTVWMGDRFPHNFQHQVFKPKLPWETKPEAKHRNKGIWVEKFLPHIPRVTQQVVTPCTQPGRGDSPTTHQEPGQMKAVDAAHWYLEEETGLHTLQLFGARLSPFLFHLHQTLRDSGIKHGSQQAHLTRTADTVTKLLRWTKLIIQGSLQGLPSYRRDHSI